MAKVKLPLDSTITAYLNKELLTPPYKDVRDSVIVPLIIHTDGSITDCPTDKRLRKKFCDEVAIDSLKHLPDGRVSYSIQLIMFTSRLAF